MVSSLITKKRIAKAFKSQFISRPFDRISVSDIMAETGMRRQTFYNHFLDKYDLMEWIFRTELSEQIIDNLTYISGFQLLNELFQFFQGNRQFYGQLFQITDQNDFSSYFEDYCQQVIEKIIVDYSPRAFVSQSDRQLFIDYHSLALANLIKHHLADPKGCDPLNSQSVISYIKASLEHREG